jgi:hypothetical protein
MSPFLFLRVSSRINEPRSCLFSIPDVPFRTRQGSCNIARHCASRLILKMELDCGIGRVRSRCILTRGAVMDRGKLEAIWIKRMKGGPMDPVPSAALVPGQGIAGNADQGGERQVTIMEQEVWEELMKQVGGSLPPSVRRANLVTSGVRLQNSEGKMLRVGSCRIRIGGEATVCGRMDEALEGLRELMDEDWRGGAYGEVVEGGEISIGDSVCWEG